MNIYIIMKKDIIKQKEYLKYKNHKNYGTLC